MYEVESVIVVDAGNDANVAYATTAGTSLEEHEVTRHQFVLADTYTIPDLTSRGAIELDAEALEYVAGETRAVKAARRHCAIAIGGAIESVGITEKLVDNVTAIVLFDLLKDGTALAC